MQQAVQSVDDYLGKVNPQHRTELERIRLLVKQFVPSAEETTSYGMPTFKYKSQPLMYFAAYKNHMSLSRLPTQLRY